MTEPGGAKGDELLERGADKLEELSQKAAERGGLTGKLAGELAEDASFLRKLKPSLIAARARGNLAAGSGERPRPVLVAPSGGAQGSRRNPFVVAGAALAAGVLLARLIDWRSHAHPRR